MSALPWQDEAWARLQSRRARGALPHALLICGDAGLGKRAFADRFVRGLLCEQPAGGDACGRCRSCGLLAAGTHPDLIAVHVGVRKDGVARKEIIVDQIRELSARLAMNSQFNGWQVACIDPADAMNPAAANALLKTLEEPIAQTLLVLVADAPWRLPQTIRSRCQRVELQRPPAADALAWLAAQGVDDGDAALAAAGGNPGLALDWARSGALERRAAVRDELAALAAGRTDALALARGWLDGDPAQCLWFAAQAVTDERKARAVRARPPLGSALDDAALAAWYADAALARERLRGPLRADLLLVELLSRWR